MDKREIDKGNFGSYRWWVQMGGLLDSTGFWAIEVWASSSHTEFHVWILQTTISGEGEPPDNLLREEWDKIILSHKIKDDAHGGPNFKKLDQIALFGRETQRL